MVVFCYLCASCNAVALCVCAAHANLFGVALNIVALVNMALMAERYQ